VETPGVATVDVERVRRPFHNGLGRSEGLNVEEGVVRVRVYGDGATVMAGEPGRGGQGSGSDLIRNGLAIVADPGLGTATDTTGGHSTNETKSAKTTNKRWLWF
jgi:hypothetical protein